MTSKNPCRKNTDFAGCDPYKGIEDGDVTKRTEFRCRIAVDLHGTGVTRYR